MNVSREQMARNRTRILDVASRLFRERGFDGVTVSEIMKTAGLTHGAFYSYFDSKDDLITHAVTHALAPAKGGPTGLETLIGTYLSPLHREHAGQGCPMAGMAGAVRHRSPEVRAAMAEGYRRQIDFLARSVDGVDAASRRRAAIGSWAAMVGAVILARAVGDEALSNELLAETQSWIKENTQTAH